MYILNSWIIYLLSIERGQFYACFPVDFFYFSDRSSIEPDTFQIRYHVIRICCCDKTSKSPKDDSCCHDMQTAAETTHSSKCPLHNNDRKSCCAFTPADGLTVEALALPTVDTHESYAIHSVAMICVNAVTQSKDRSQLAFSFDSPQPFDTPVYLRTHSFLI